MVSLVTVCSMICFLEIKRYQTIIVLKGATYVVFFKSLLHWCFYVLVSYSKPVPVWLSVWFLPTEQLSFVLIQAPAIRYAYRLHSRYDFSKFRLIVTPLLSLIVKKLRCWASCFTLRPKKLQYKLHPEFWLMKYFWNILLNIFSYVQAGLWMVQSVRLSITPFSLCSHHHIIMKLPLMKVMPRSEVKDQGHVGQNPI